jgi:hypothetical protein
VDRVPVSHWIVVGKCWVSRKTCELLSNPYQRKCCFRCYNKTVLIICTGSKYSLVIQCKLHSSQGMGSCMPITAMINKIYILVRFRESWPFRSTRSHFRVSWSSCCPICILCLCYISIYTVAFVSYSDRLVEYTLDFGIRYSSLS